MGELVVWGEGKPCMLCGRVPGRGKVSSGVRWRTVHSLCGSAQFWSLPWDHMQQTRRVPERSIGISQLGFLRPPQLLQSGSWSFSMGDTKFSAFHQACPKSVSAPIQLLENLTLRRAQESLKGPTHAQQQLPYLGVRNADSHASLGEFLKRNVRNNKTPRSSVSILKH